MAADFTRTLSFSPTFDSAAKEKWSPPCFGMWKVNCDASYKDGVAALGMVIRDDCGTLIEATTKLISCYSAYEAEVKVVEWATSMTAIGERNNLIFISCAAKVVEEINSNTELKGWHTNEGIYNIHACLLNNIWKIVWNRRSANRLAHALVKLPLSSHSSLSFSSFNLDRLPETLYNIYASEIVGGSAYL